MKTTNKTPFTPIFAALLGLAFLPAVIHANEADEQKALLEKAKITEADARATALAKYPGAKVKDSELEEEHGLLIWSFDLTQPKSENITEVQVNALTGKIANVEIETPADIAKEAKEDKGHADKEDKK